jgi:hypothetical protein
MLGVVFLVRRISTVLVTLALAAGNVGLCAGWMPTAEARMACCAENDSCPMHKSDSSAGDEMRVVSQADADRCCASSSTDDSAPSPAAFALTSPLAIVTSPVPFVLPQPQTYHQFWRSLVPGPPTDVPRHVLLSVFLV